MKTVIRPLEREKVPPGGWVPGGISTKSRSIVMSGLTPGQVYSVQVRAIGGSTGYSDWSDPSSHMVM